MIITIGRQFGSSGNRIGRIVAEQLGIPFYDKNIIEHVAEKLGFSPQYVKQVAEKPTGSFLFSMAMHTYGTSMGDGLVPAELQVSTAQAEFILEKAKLGTGVFVGRCADYLLKDRKDVFRVFVHANMKSRIETVMSRYGIEERQAVRMVQQTDKRRASYYNTNTQQRWGAKESYDLLVDSGTFGMDGAVAIIEYAAKQFEEKQLG